MRNVKLMAALLATLVFSGAAAAQVRGKGRIGGTITDKESGKPVADAKITVAPSDGSTTPVLAKSNAKGKWSALGLTSGVWNVDIEAKGYQTSRGTVNVSELQMAPPIKTELTPDVVEVEVPVETTPGVPQEIVDAVNAGQDLLAAGKYAEAVVQLEKASAGLPDNLPLKQLLGQAYYKAGELKKAITTLEAVRAADASNSGVALLLTNLYLEDKQLDKGREMLATVPAGQITDPTVYLNIGILFLNGGNQADAASFFSKAIELDATKAEGYYYRGLAYLQMRKTAEAKADLKKVVELAPDSTEAKDANQMLKDLK